VVANGARALVLGHGVSVRESEIRERKKREDERGEAAEKREKIRDGSGQPDPVF
jgi:hypothetical protein